MIIDSFFSEITFSSSGACPGQASVSISAVRKNTFLIHETFQASHVKRKWRTVVAKIQRAKCAWRRCLYITLCILCFSKYINIFKYIGPEPEKADKMKSNMFHHVYDFVYETGIVFKVGQCVTCGHSPGFQACLQASRPSGLQALRLKICKF